MRKILAFLGLSGLFLSLLACDQLIFTQATLAPSTTLSTTTASTTVSSTIPMTTGSTVSTDTSLTLSYDDYNDLINQLADMIREEIGDDIDQYMNYPGTGIAQDDSVYQEIYAEVEARLRSELLDPDIIGLDLDSIQQKLLEVAGIAERSVVGITSYLDQTGQALGSGVIYKYDPETNIYFVITNHHVIEDGDNFKVVFYEGSRVTAHRLGYDSDVDVAVLYFLGEALPIELIVSQLGDSDEATPGEIVIAGGNPRGYNFYGSVTMGILSGVDRNVSNPDVLYLQHDASINSGNSGGPLYNLQGEVIGINVLKYASTDIEGMGFAIPIDQIKAMLTELEVGAPVA